MYGEYRTLDVEIYRAEKLPVSAAGTPRWRLFTSEGTFLTETNASINLSMENYCSNSREETGFPQLIGRIGRLITLIHTRNRKVNALMYRGRQYR